MNVVRELTDDELIASWLERDPRWTAYALCDLEPQYRRNARFFGAIERDCLQALMLTYHLSGAVAMHTYGTSEGILAILEGGVDLPEAPFMVLEGAHREAVERRFRFDELWPMCRMTARTRGVPEAPAPGFQLRMLSVRDADAIRALFAEWGTAFFDDEMLAHGVYAGAYMRETLVAVAGTHVASRRFRLAAIGGVFTSADHRGKGLAKATTGMVMRALADLGIELAVLNVRLDNDPAIRAYKHLGFVPYVNFLEGRAARTD
jgi:[ribosomal protein S18]-alanine N-acetyltransferase